MTKRILAVDDSPSIRKMVGFTLRSAGYEVVEAEDGQDGRNDRARLAFVELEGGVYIGVPSGALRQ